MKFPLFAFSLIFIFLSPLQNFSQQNEVITSEEPAKLEKREDVLIKVNGVKTDFSDKYEVEKNRKLDFQVRYLKPRSDVFIRIRKGGFKVKTYRFAANSKGELDLEVNTGRKKIKGKATLEYMPSGGQKRVKEVQVLIR